MGTLCSIDLNFKYYGGGSGGGFRGKVRLKKGNYTIKVGGGQYWKKTENSIIYYSKPEVSSISNVVSCTGASRQSAGAKPTINSNVTVVSTTLNTAGNAGGYKGPVNSADGMIVGASVYGGYGKGSAEPCTYMFEENYTPKTYAGNGYVKIVYTGA